MWIDCDYNDDCSSVGDTGFLVKSFSTNHARETYHLRDEPLRTNRSHEPKLFGWCGETNNVSRTAMGVWRIAKANKAGTRVLIAQVTGAELAAFLDEAGYPELLEEEAAQ